MHRCPILLISFFFENCSCFLYNAALKKMCHIDKLTKIHIIIELLHIFHDFFSFPLIVNSICIKKYILCSNILDFASLVVRAGGGGLDLCLAVFCFCRIFVV